jgi:hypothetical protein
MASTRRRLLFVAEIAARFVADPTMRSVGFRCAAIAGSVVTTKTISTSCTAERYPFSLHSVV